MMLGLLIPHFAETPREVEPLLGSVALQQNVDFGEIEAVIAFDGPGAEPLPIGEWSERYPFAVRGVHTPGHGGVSACRNAALDASEADYVMFCDADDMFYNMCGLQLIWPEMERGFDMLVSNFIEETRKDGRPFHVPHPNDSTFVHGKAFRREWLQSEGIRFDQSLTVHEDSYMVSLARELADDARYCPEPFYLWRWRDSSVCRHDPDYILKTYPQMLDSCDELVRELERRGKVDAARARAGAMVLDAYYTVNKPEWLDRTHTDYRAAVEARFSRFFADFGHYWDEMGAVERMATSNGIRTRSVMEGMGMESLTIGQWLEGAVND